MTKMTESEKTMESIKSALADFLSENEVDSTTIILERPPDFKKGDISTNIALQCSKALGKNPVEIAEDIKAYLLSKELENIETIEVVKPGFINIFFSQSFFDEIVSNILKSDTKYGANEKLKGQKWVVEHTSPNPNKAMHLGHLRNNLVGMGLVRLLETSGADVASDAVDNNRGIAIAKLMWGFLAHMKKDEDTPSDPKFWYENQHLWFTPADKGMKPDVFVTKCYILGEEDIKENPESEKKVRSFVVDWEAKDKYVWKLWTHVLGYAYEGIDKTLSRLGSHWDKVWHEHEHYESGKNFVNDGLKKGVFKKLEDGAILTNLEKYNLPDTILLKNDGTSLYVTQDIALTALKKKTYKADKLVWVIGPEQSLAMKQLFAICDQLGIGKFEDFTHIPYGYVGLRGEDGGFKKMSSRKGTVVLIDDVIDGIRDKILDRFIEKGRTETPELKDLSEKLALSAVKFSILRPNRAQDLIFDVDKSIETSGDSGIYIQYTYVRIKSILNKAKNQEIKTKEIANSSEGEEGSLVRLLMFFPEVIERSTDDLSVHHITQYLLEVSSAFNTWYGKEVILDGSEQQKRRLLIAEATSIVIRNGLSILGIDVVEEI